MHFSKKINIGNLTVNFEIDESLEWKFKEASKLFKTTSIGSDAESYNIKFIRVQRKELKYEKVPVEAEKTLNKYLKYHVGFLHNIGKKYLVTSFSYFARSAHFFNMLKQNRKRFNKDFLLFGVTGRLLVILDALNKEGSVFYTRFLSWKRGPTSLAFCIYLIISILSSITKSFILHCAALKIKGKGYLFIGKSGEGKSTISRMILRNVKNSKIVSDDKVLVTYNPIDKYFYALKLPFDRKELSFIKKTRCMRINKVYYIKKSKRTFLKSLEKYKSFREILNEHMQYALWFRESIKKLPLLVLRFANKYPPKILYFKKNRSFIELLKS